MKKLFILLLPLIWVVVISLIVSPNPSEKLPIEKLPSKGTIPRLAWYSVPPSETSLLRYEELKEAGITINFSFFKTIAEAEKSLNMAQKVGIKIVLSCDELKTEPEKTVRRFMNHPALAGYFLRDEPSRSEFADLAKWAKRIQSVDEKHFCYVNALPIYAENWQFETAFEQDTLTSLTYREYISTYIKEVPMQFISYDAYCVIGDSLRANYYENLEIMADECKKAGKDFWAFGLTTGSSLPVNFPPPTLAELRLQIYSILAYGAQGVQYFTYWTPGPEENNVWDFYKGPIGLDGRRTVTYDRLKQMNEEVKNLSGVFYGSKVLSVRHTGEATPKGTRRLSKLPDGIKVLDTNGAGALVSILQNGSNNFVVVVNSSFKKSMNLTLYGDEKLKKVLKDGTVVPANFYTHTMEVEPGDAAIYMLGNDNN
uniref:hypothetical protein n=1 Tax=Pedobacter schmidteae TaxID=2201271 RepID=UPI0018D51611|nr:hypothetical protein [Pedobacter schmidteae]